MKTKTTHTLVIVFICLVVCFPTMAQMPSIITDLCIGGSQDDFPSRLVKVSGISGLNYVIPGNSTSSNGDLSGNLGSTDSWLVGLDATYNVNFSDNTGGTDVDLATDAFVDAVGEVSVIGQSYSTQFGNHGGGDIFLYKRSTAGIKTSQKCIGGTLDDKGVRLLYSTATNKFIALGDIKSTDGDITGLTHHGQSDVGVFELDQSFTITHSFLIGSSGFDIVNDAYLDNNYLWILGETDGSDYDFAGTTPNGSDDIFIKKYDVTNWSLQATYRYGGNDTDHGYRLCFNPGYGYYITGASYSTNFGTCNYGQLNGRVLKCDLSGNIVWNKCLSGSGDDIAISGAMSYTFPGVYYVCGHTLSNDGDFTGGSPLTAWKCFIAALNDFNGDVLWLHKYGGSSNDFSDDVTETPLGNLFTLNHTYSNDGDVMSLNHGLNDVWLVEMSNPTSVNEVGNFNTVIDVFPNPASTKLTIRLNEKKYKEAEYAIYDITGREVLSGNAGLPLSNIDISGFNNGIYCIRVKSAENILNKKFEVSN